MNDTHFIDAGDGSSYGEESKLKDFQENICRTDASRSHNCHSSALCQEQVLQWIERLRRHPACRDSNCSAISGVIHSIEKILIVDPLKRIISEELAIEMVGHLQQAQDEVEGFYSNSEPAEPISYRSESDPGSALRGTAFAATSSSCPRELSGPDVRGISTRLQPRLVVVTQAEGAQELSEPASPDDTSMQKASRSSMTNLARHNENPEPIDLGKNKVIKHSWGKHGKFICTAEGTDGMLCNTVFYRVADLRRYSARHDSMCKMWECIVEGCDRKGNNGFY